MGAWQECTTCEWGGLATVYHLCVCGGGAGTSVPLVCVCGGGVARSHHSLTATVNRGTVSLVSLSRCSASGVRIPLFHGSPCTTVPPVPRFPLYHGSTCTMVPPVPWFPCTSVNPALGEVVVRTFKRENPGSVPLAAGFFSISFTPRCFSSLNCINEYMSGYRQ